ncbi:MAG: hypothetical protein KBG22_12145 [Smithella sp.]|nr:hypothetical protein [Smithella sp.]
MKSSIIFLDFDGVIFDTVDEAYNIALGALSQEKADIMRTPKGKELFYKYRYLITDARSYQHLIFSICKVLNKYEGDIESLFKEMSVYKTQESSEFEERFYAHRAFLRRHAAREWLSWHRPYPFLQMLVEVWDSIKDRIFIVTTKDEEAVQELMSMHASDTLANVQVLGREYYKRVGSKRALIADLMRDLKAGKSLLVDDSFKVIEECRGLPDLTCLQAAWGYCRPGDPVVAAEEVIDQIMSKHGG